jgi:mono/diheme cytochrome c family protein
MGCGSFTVSEQSVWSKDTRGVKTRAGYQAERSSFMKSLVPFFILLISFVISPFAWAGEEFNPDTIKNPIKSSAGSIKNGRKLYLENCTVCHGMKADGNGPSAGSFAMEPWSFTDGTIDDISDGYLFQKIKNGGPWYEMPPFMMKLKDKDIWDTINYLKSVAKKS